MKTFKLMLILFLVLALSVLALQNQASWQVRFLWMAGEVPGIVLLFLTASAGFAAGIAVALSMKRGSKPIT